MRWRLWRAGVVGAAFAATGCSYARLLLAPPVPARARGEASTYHGPAYLAGDTTALAAPDSLRDWATYNRTLDGNRYSPLTQISVANVSAVIPTCRFPLGEQRNMQSGLLAIDGTLYFSTLEETYAVDAASCALRWRHIYRLSVAPPFDPNQTNRGLAYLDGTLFRGTNDGRLLALDARTGEERWNVVAGDPERGETFPAAPIAWHGLVYIGNAGGDNFGVRGRLMAFDARTGARRWSTSLVAESDDAASTWPGETELQPRSGGATWSTYTLDTLAGIIFVSTGNAAPDFLDTHRAGENLYTTSVAAVDASSGAIRAYYKLLAHDVHDWDIAAAPALVLTRGGERLVIAAGKDGHLYGVERANGAIQYRTVVTTIDNVDAPLTSEGTRFCPGVNGGTEWNGPAYSPRTNLIYVNATDWCTTVRLATSAPGRRGLPWTGSAQTLHPFGVNDPAWRGWINAVDADAGVVRWRVESRTPVVAAITPTAGGLLLTGDLEGHLLMLDQATGGELRRIDLGQPIGGGIITYMVGDRQYIAVASGMHSPVGWRLHSTPATVTVLTLAAGAH